MDELPLENDVSASVDFSTPTIERTGYGTVAEVEVTDDIITSIISKKKSGEYNYDDDEFIKANSVPDIEHASFNEDLLQMEFDGLEQSISSECNNEDESKPISIDILTDSIVNENKDDKSIEIKDIISNNSITATTCKNDEEIHINKNNNNNNNHVDEMVTYRAEVFISGMTCTMCSHSVDTALRNNIPGIVSVDISLTTDTAQVVWKLKKNIPFLANNTSINDDSNKNNENGSSSICCIGGNNNNDIFDEHNNQVVEGILKKIRVTITDIGYNVDDIHLLSPIKLTSSKNSRKKNKMTIKTKAKQSQQAQVFPSNHCNDEVNDIMIVEFENDIHNANIPSSLAEFQAAETLQTHTRSQRSDLSEIAQIDPSTTITVSDTALEQEDQGGDHDENDEDDDENDEQEIAVDDRWRLYRERQILKLNQRRRAFLVSLVGTVPILILTMVLPYVLDTDTYIFHHRTLKIFHRYQVSVQALVLWILATPVQFICGYEFYKMAWYGFQSGRAGMDVLVALGTSASYGYAVVVGVLNHDDHASHFFETSAVLICFVLAGKWMQAIAVQRTSDALSQLMELQCKTAIRILPASEGGRNATSANLLPASQSITPTVNNKTNNNVKVNNSFNPLNDAFIEEIVDIRLVKVNDMVKILRGASIPADGIVAFGEILVDESMVTGESLPVLKTVGSSVLGGTVCVETSSTASPITATDANTVNLGESSHNGSNQQLQQQQHQDILESTDEESLLISSSHLSSQQQLVQEQGSVGAGFVRVTGVGSNTALAQIVSMVQQAQTRSVPIQSFVDSISAVFVPCVCAISLITYLVWYALCSSNVVPSDWYEKDGYDTTTFSLMFAIACLVISCPCALGLATPTAVMVGTGVGASKCGVLMKGGQALEVASQVDTIVLDKTGTVTKGTPAVSDCIRIITTTHPPDSGKLYMENTSRSFNIRSTSTRTVVVSSMIPTKRDRTTSRPRATLNNTLSLADQSASHTDREVNANTMCPVVMNDNSDDLKYLLWLFGSLERTSEHPLAKAVVRFAEQYLGPSELELHPFAQPSQFIAKTGRGCQGTFVISSYPLSDYDNIKNPNSKGLQSQPNTTNGISHVKVLIGNRSYAAISAIRLPNEANERMKRLERQGKTAVFGAVNGQVCLVFGIADELKPDAKASVQYLQNQLNIDVWMVTGDNSRTALSVARQLNIPFDRVVSEALPGTKLAIVRKLQQQPNLRRTNNVNNGYRVVAMVGDGVNDSPALVQADVGMSIGSGASQIAAEASDMVLVKGDVASICTAIHLSRAIFQRIQLNLVFSLLYNVLGIPIAAGVFYPLIHTRLPPTIAALAMACSSISVVVSSLTLRWYKPPDVSSNELRTNDISASNASDNDDSNSTSSTTVTNRRSNSTGRSHSHQRLLQMRQPQQPNGKIRKNSERNKRVEQQQLKSPPLYDENDQLRVNLLAHDSLIGSEYETIITDGSICSSSNHYLTTTQREQQQNKSFNIVPHDSVDRSVEFLGCISESTILTDNRSLRSSS